MRNFYFLLGRQRPYYILVTICSALVGGLEAFIHPLLLKAIFDALALKEDFSQFVLIGIAYLTLGVFVNAAFYFLNLWKMRVDNRIVASVSGTLLESYYSKDYGKVINEGDGYYVARIRSDVKDGLRPMLELVRTIVVSIFSFILLICVLIYLSWQAFVLLALIIPVATIISILVSKKIKLLTNTEREAEAALLDNLTKSVAAFKTVGLFSLEPQTMRAFKGKMKQTLGAIYKRYRVVLRLQTASDLTMVVSDASTIFVGAWLVFRNQMSIGSFIGFMNAFWRAATTLISIFNNIAVLIGLVAIVDRLTEFNSDLRHVTKRDVGPNVEARSIDYAYGENLVISNFNLTVKAGERILVIGENGSGKTTLANILNGLLSPSIGSLKLPEKISAATLPVMFPPVQVKDLPIDEELLKIFDLNTPELLNSWPDQLSAGQKQKLTLGLVLSQKSELYILDEPFANLDTRSRELAMKEIKIRTSDDILIMIMHESEHYWKIFDQVIQLESVVNKDICEKII